MIVEPGNGTGSLAQMRYHGGGIIVKLFCKHDAGGVNVVDRAIVVVGCTAEDPVAVSAAVDEACRSRSILCAMVCSSSSADFHDWRALQ